MKGLKISVRRRIFLLLLGVGVLSFLALGVISLKSMYGIQRNAEQSGEAMGASAATYVEDYATEKTTRQLMMLADKKAKQVETEMGAALENAQSLASNVEYLLDNPGFYAPRHLPTPTSKRIKKGEAYCIFTSHAPGEPLAPEISREMELLSNISDELEVLSDLYDGYEVSCYVASKYGFMVEADAVPSEEAYRRIFTEQFINEYDPRERDWYEAAREAGEPIMTDVYVGNDAHAEITCAAPFYHNDELAGVVGIDLHLFALSRMLSDRTLGKKNISFGVNQDGVVLFSTEQDGPLAVNIDLRDNETVVTVIHTLEVACRTEQVDGTIFALISFKTFKYSLTIVEYHSRRLDLKRTIRNDPRIDPSLTFNIVHDEHVVGEDVSERQRLTRLRFLSW